MGFKNRSRRQQKRCQLRRICIEPLESRRLLTAAANPFDLSTLDGETGFRLDGYVRSGWAGWSVNEAGDVNGDEIPDLIIGAKLGAGSVTGTGAPHDQGSAFVVFGRAEGFPATSKLNTLDGTNGFELRNSAGGNGLGHSVSGAGDFNGDGFADVLISEPYANDRAGTTFVVFGKASGYPAMVDLAQLDGTDGFRIDGGLQSGWFYRMSGAGDLNGDGYDDLILSRPSATTSPFLGNEGAVYVVYGSDVGSYQSGVTAEIVDSVLQVTGDNSANHIRVSATRIEGLDGTTVNGLDVFDFAFVSEIRISLGGGADTVIADSINPIYYPTLNIDTGSGRDYVHLNGYFSRNHVIDTGGGNDHVVIEAILLNSDLDIKTGSGDDRVEVIVSDSTTSEVAETRIGSVKLGGGDDVFQWTLTPSGAYGEPRGVIDGGKGNDRISGDSPFEELDFEGIIGSANGANESLFVGGEVTTAVEFDPTIGNILVIKGKDAFDHDLQLSSSAIGQVSLASLGYGSTISGITAFNDIARVKVVLGSGRDRVFTNGLWLSDALIVNTGLGNDNVQVQSSQIGKLKIDTGGGSDSLLIDSTAVDRRSRIFAGWGNDTVTLRDSTFGRKAILEGGMDDDTLHLLGVNLFSKGLEEDFEQVHES